MRLACFRCKLERAKNKEYMKKVNRSKIHEIDNVIYHKEYYLL
ncbi:DUF1660 family phage protein [Longicatena caecimuris]|nr:hypothetical protein DW093_05500 [Erysipelotrichaceae bacterium AM07-12]RGD46431.1 hypothetical protein DW100_06305 [Erysipelotrichaceae bacterium AM07-35-1]